MNLLRSSALLRAALVAVTVLITGCSSMSAPPYQPSIDNVETIKRADLKPATLGAFTIMPDRFGGNRVIELRAASMISPVGKDYAAYVGEALRQELVLAGRIDAASPLEISGVLIKNDIAAGGINTNSGEIEMRFVVRKAGAVAYDAVKRIEETWESSFMGAVAIPRAQQKYPQMVQKLLEALLKDPAFQAALR